MSAPPAVETELIAAMEAWDRAMVENDPEAIGAYMADDWTIVGPDGTPRDRQCARGGRSLTGARTCDTLDWMLRISWTAGTLLLLALLSACGGYDEGRYDGPTGPTYPDPPPASSDDDNPWDY